MKDRKIYLMMSWRFLLWVMVGSLAFLLHFTLNYKHIWNFETVSYSVYVELIVVNLVWISSLSIPIAGLFTSTGTYTALLKSLSSKPLWSPSLRRFVRFLLPSIALGGFIAIISFVIIVSILPDTNKRAREIFWEINTGESMPERLSKYNTDREKSLGELLEDTEQISLDIHSSKDQRERKQLSNKYNNLMIEVYKKFSIPLLGLIFPVLGCILSLLFIKIKSGRRILLFIFNVFIILLMWYFLLIGENYGDNGTIPPLLSMSLAPGLALLLVAALGKRSYEIFINLSHVSSGN